MSDLTAEELRVTGGSWHGLLFQNPAANYPLTLTWSFTIDFEEVNREYGSIAPSLTIEWVPAATGSWDSLAGQRFISSSFAGPAESSLYFFEHFRFDRVELAVETQSLHELTVNARVAGDLDGLGVPTLDVAAGLAFGGIYVQTDESGSDVAAASALLARFVSLDGLVGKARAHNVLFERSS